MAFRRRSTVALAGVLAVVSLAGCGRSRPTSTTEVTTETTTAAQTPANGTVWLCFPGRASNPCATPLTATEILGDGTRRVHRYAPATNPPIDCFYVYPTVSDAKTGNASRTIGLRETLVAEAQAAPFSRVCRVFAPMYRQVTEAGLVDGSLHARPLLAYNDVLRAWRWYLAHENHGRGVVLVGHSQGAYVLKHLVSTVIDRSPSQRRLLVSALLLGGQVRVATGPAGRGDFQHVPPCTSTVATGCVVAYSSFDHRPPTKARFGRSADPAVRIACVNPASPSGGKAVLSPLFPTLVLRWLAPDLTPPSTPWVAFPGLYTAECLSDGTASWLQVDHTRAAGDTRPIVRPTFGRGWGLHGVDVNIALGDLVTLVAAQSVAYTAAH